MDFATSTQLGQTGKRPGSRPGTHSLPQSARTGVPLTMPSTTELPTGTKSSRALRRESLEHYVSEALVITVIEDGIAELLLDNRERRRS